MNSSTTATQVRVLEMSSLLQGVIATVIVAMAVVTLGKPLLKKEE